MHELKSSCCLSSASSTLLIILFNREAASEDLSEEKGQKGTEEQAVLTIVPKHDATLEFIPKQELEAVVRRVDPITVHTALLKRFVKMVEIVENLEVFI